MGNHCIGLEYLYHIDTGASWLPEIKVTSYHCRKKNHIVEQEPKTNGRVTLNMGIDINYRQPYLFENDDKEIAPCIKRVLISSLSHDSCSRILDDRRKKMLWRQTREAEGKMVLNTTCL